MRTSRLLLSGIAMLACISACSTVPQAPPPVVVQCSKPRVDQALVAPAERAAAMRLQDYLLTLPPSASATPTGSMPSPRK